MNLYLIFGSLWALLLLGGWLGLPRFLHEKAISVKWAGPIIVAVALGVRLVPNFVLPMGAGYDIESYQIVGDLVRQGEEVYSNPATVNRHPYLPLQMYWMAFARWASEGLHYPFVKIVRLAPIGADVAIALLLFWLLQRLASPRAAVYSGLSYALNPVPVFVSAYHGQFDAIPALCVLLALYWLERSPLFAGSWLGLGILDKGWPVLALPSLLVGSRKWRRRLLLIGAAVAVPLIGVALYVSVFRADPVVVLKRALGYNWGVGVWGYTYFFHLLAVLQPDFAAPFRWLVRYGRYLTLAALGLVWLIRARKESPQAGVLTILVAFFAVTHAFSIQYLMWVVPFAILSSEERDRQWLCRYTLAAFSYMFLTYMTLILSSSILEWMPWDPANTFVIRPSALPAWLVTVGWLLEKLLSGDIGRR